MDLCGIQSDKLDHEIAQSARPLSKILTLISDPMSFPKRHNTGLVSKLSVKQLI